MDASPHLREGNSIPAGMTRIPWTRPMSIPKDFIELLRDKIDIVDLISHYLQLRKKSGTNYFALCPFHQEKSGSFCVSQSKQCYHCFGCGAHGNAIDFLMQHERLSFPDAIENLARLVGMPVPHSLENKKEASLSSVYDLNEQVANEYKEQLRQSNRAILYLKQRGMTGQIAKQFELGFAPNAWHHLLDQFGKAEQGKKELFIAGLVIKKEDHSYYDRFRDRIMFPIHDYRGRIVGFGGRIIDQGEPKYMNSPETPLFQKSKELYGLYHALKANPKIKRFVVVEGYMDVISLFQHGITYAVATLGTATTSQHLNRLTRYTQDIIFCFDGDSAGRQAALRALQMLMPHLEDNLHIYFLFLPEGEDPDSLIKKEGQTDFEARLSEATPLSTFFFQHLASQFEIATLEGRAGFAASALESIKQIPGKMLSEVLLEELAKRVRIDINELRAQLKQSTKVSEDAFIHHQPIAKLKPFIQLALTLIIQHPELAELVTTPLPNSRVQGLPFLQRLITSIQNLSQKTTASLMEYWRGEKESRFIASLAVSEHAVPEAGLKQEFLGALHTIHLLALDEEINLLLSKATNESLSEIEKQTLSNFIKQKKSILQTS